MAERISEAMVEAALAVWFETNEPWYAGMANDVIEGCQKQMRACLEAALSAAPASAQMEGWQMVPVEPTEAMLAAGDDARRDRTDVYFDGSEVVHGDMVADVYAAMLAAAPLPTSEGSNG